MPDLIIYLLKVNIAVLLFCAGYYGLLRRLTFYQLNRYYLLFAISFSLLYPFMDFSTLWARQQAIPVMAGVPISSLSFETDRSFSAWSYVEALLGIALVVMAARLAVQLISIRRIHRHSSPDQWKQYVYRNTRQAISPFSFWKQIYVHRAGHPEPELPEIFRHEFIHVQQLHSIDVLLAELLLLISWFNPGAWLLRRAIRENLEFITDRRVLQSGLDAKTYQYNLLKTLTEQQPRLANNFNFKNLKKRIIMMNKKQSSQYHLGKYLLLVPIILLFVSVFTISKAYQEQKTSTSASDTAKKVTSSQPGATIHIVKGRDTIPSTHIEINETKPSNRQDTLKTTSLRGKVSGLEIKKANNEHITAVKLDGKDPLIVLNGVPADQKILKSTHPDSIESVAILKDSAAIARYDEKAMNGVILITTKAAKKEPHIRIKTDSVQRKQPSKPNSLTNSASGMDDPLYMLDGKEIDKSVMELLDPNKIQRIDVFKNSDEAVKKYGSKALKGVIVITSKK